MIRVLTVLMAAVFTFALMAPDDADAGRRFGGGRSSGMQRQAPPPQQSVSRPDGTMSPASAAQPRSGASRWLGPLAGFGLGALFMSMFGGGAFAGFLGNVLMFILLFAAIRFAMRMWQARQQGGAQPMRYAGAAPNSERTAPETRTILGGGAEVAMPQRVPAGFDAAGFLRQAKVSFIRLQAANDAGDLNDIRDYTTPELYGEIALQIQERGGAKQRVEVVQLEAELLEVITEGGRQIASVQFSGLMREEENANAEPFSEIWHVVKDASDAKSPWMIAGIQQR